MYVHLCTFNLKHKMQPYFNNIMLAQLEMGNLPGSHINDLFTKHVQTIINMVIT